MQATGGSLIELLILVPFLLTGVAYLGIWIWALLDCIQKEPPEQDRLVWMLVIILAQFLGAILYVIVRRPERIRRYGR